MASSNQPLLSLQREIDRLKAGGSLSIQQLQDVHDQMLAASRRPSYRVAIHTSFGGFSLTQAAYERLKELGVSMCGSKDSYYLPDSIERDDPRLIQVIEELGEFASPDGDIEIVEVRLARPEIHNFDGKESINQGEPTRFPPEKTYWGALTGALLLLGYQIKDENLEINGYKVSRDISQRDWARVWNDSKISDRINIANTAEAVKEIEQITKAPSRA